MAIRKEDLGVTELDERVWELCAEEGWTEAQIMRVIEVVCEVEVERLCDGVEGSPAVTDD